MRTLIVDNYDSFTYNLFHYIAEVNGVEPTVIRNDDPSWRPELLDEFDNVVLSPGPGHPERPRDFGLCRDVIDADRVPVLGVCLGHQGICHVLGGEVTAIEPRHGRLSEVHHDGSDLFAGIPAPFEVVRYHSFAVEKLPPQLIASAWTDDGVLMAVRHRDRPLWGVQFHPESIRSEYGHRLLTNFRDATARWHAEHPGQDAAAGSRRDVSRTTRPDRVAPRWQILVRQVQTPVDTETLFDAEFRGGEHPYWLDSSQRDGELGAVSILGDASGPLARVARADVASGTVTITGHGGEHTVRGLFLDWLGADLAANRAEPEQPLPFDFALGWVGYLGYELKAECGANLAHPAPTPDAVMVFADRAVVVDHRCETVYLLALAPMGQPRSAEEWLTAMAGKVSGLAGATLTPEPVEPGHLVQLRHGRGRYLELIGACLQAIDAGESYEVCLTNMLTVQGPLPPWPTYQALRRISPAPFAALLDFGEVAVLSTSPERFLRIRADGLVESKPIKGTRPRGDSAEEDDALRLDLRGNEKDQAENLMIVDLVRNDLGRVGEVGTVRVPKLFDVQSYATVHQMISTVRANLRPGFSAVDCVRAAFPGGSMTGAPKLRTMEIIDSLEAGPRGVYSGALGYFSLTGAADLSIVIRTLVIAGDRAHYGVGGAIIALSDPDAEFEETAVKASGLLELLGVDFPGRLQPEERAVDRSPVTVGRPAARARRAAPMKAIPDTAAGGRNSRMLDLEEPREDPISGYGDGAVENNVAFRLAHEATSRGWCDRPAYVDDAKVWTHGRVHDWAARVAAVLADRGVVPGDRVMLVLPDCAEWIGCFLALGRLGAVAVPVNPALTAHDYATLIADCQPVAVIGDESVAAHFERTTLLRLEELDAAAQSADPAPPHPVGAEAPLYIQYTSGTTGQPKGAVHRHADLRHYHLAVGEAMLALRAEDVSLSVSRLFFAYGLGNSLVYPLHSGSCAILSARRPGPDVITELARRHRVTVLHGVPSAYAALVAEASDPDAFRTVRVAVSAGEPLAPALGDRASALLGAPVLDELGSTEIGGACCANRLDDNSPGTIGRPLPGYDLRVCDEAGNPLDGVAEGELWVRGPTLLTGYLNRPEETDRVLVGQWLRTGDSVRRLADGRYQHRGRLDDLEMVGGITVSPVEIERVLLTHPLVREVAVAAVRDHIGASKLRAYVVCATDPAEAAGLPDELIALARSRLAAFKVPRSVEFVGALPRTATGKLRRFVVRQGLG